MIGRMFQRRGNQLVEVTNPSVILADTSNLVQGNTAPVYVNADTGDDVNDGMTANTAVRTINKALELAANRGKSGIGNTAVRVVLAGGEYTENVRVTGRILFDAQGAVIINGVVYADFGGLLGFWNGHYTINGRLASMCGGIVHIGSPDWVVNGVVHVHHNAALNIATSGTINYVSQSDTAMPAALYAGENASLYVSNANTTITITGSNAHAAVRAYTGGTIIFFQDTSLNINMVNNINCITVDYNGIMATVSDSLTINGSYNDSIVYAGTGGLFNISQNMTISGTPTGTRFTVNSGALITTNGAGIYRLPGSREGIIDTATFGCYF